MFHLALFLQYLFFFLVFVLVVEKCGNKTEYVEK